MSATTIGEALAAKRLDLGLEKGQAAQRIGMSRTTYSSYEQDAQRPSVDVFPAIAEFLDASMDEVLTLYGATCVVQARTFLARVSEVGPSRTNNVASVKSTTSLIDNEPMDHADEKLPEQQDSVQEKAVPDAVSNADGAMVNDNATEIVDELSEVPSSSTAHSDSTGPKDSGSKKKKKKKKKKD